MNTALLIEKDKVRIVGEKFKWGIIGPGRIAETFARDIKVVQDAQVYAVASRSGSSQLADKFGVDVTYGRYEDLVNDRAVDAVYIATPHPFHAAPAEMCLRAGKPVLVEKPLTVNAAETEALVNLSREKGVFLMEAMWTRFLPVHQQIKTWLDEGRIGEIQAVRASFGFRLMKGDEDRWLNPHLAGGALLDIGIYPLSISQWVLNADPADVQAQAVRGNTGVDVYITANMKYANGAVAQFAATFLADTRDDLQIIGTDGKIIIPKNFHMAEKAELHVYGEKTRKFKQKHRSGGFEFQIEEAMNCMRDGKLESGSMTHDQSLGNMRVMDEIRAQIGVKYPFE